ncbi:dihydrolipoamide acetyltransferase family protein [Nocardia amikacinitolerans]|uniref:dihydrolipoamide acetyltransferase family protein n=1 Tax=Nocardia amikacinitolerans TaxID=756689 RepID=UPI0020A4097E|nr:dihydrolipoamide acetyltransferase family protein [Nocardia amikacinitolerans]MCP2277306.1 pyruvate dehydrogenase E2 component (dihydrolipoamide acetyltransferase) [Nocardia amikacinitolerans]
MEDDGHVLEFRLPDLGEGLAEAEVVSWSVGVGDSVELNQTIAEVETAKAVVALPSPFAGRVEELLAQPGETVEVGAPLIRVRVESPPAAGPWPVPSSTPADETPPSEGNGRTSVLVGYGPEGEAESRRRRPAPEGRAAATPAARKLAKELGIDLWFVAGSGPDGAVTVDDVRGAVPVSQPRTAAPATDITPANRPAPTVTEPNAGVIRPAVREERAPITGIRKRTAAAMVASARTIPQASVFVTIDCTASMELLDHLRTTKSFAGLTLTPLALVAKATLAAIAEFPGVNAYWDEANQQIVTKHYVNLGIAVATERGLLVPNLKEAQSLSLRDLCREIGWLAETARSGSATPADLRGGTFTVTNVGVFGVDTGVPLVNPGEAAILCLGSIRKRPWVFRDELAVRWVTTLGLGFDHRMIDGELAARFLATTAGFLEDPLTLLSRM